VKQYRKMKRRQRSRLSSMERKSDTVQRRGDVSRRRDDTREGEREETTSVVLTRILLGQKNE
jgi:hypothetical protein